MKKSLIISILAFLTIGTFFSHFSQVAKNQELEEELEEIRTALGLYMRAEKPDPDCS